MRQIRCGKDIPLRRLRYASIVRTVPIRNANGVREFNLSMRLDALNLAKKNGSAHTSVEQTNKRFRRTKTVDNPAILLWAVVVARGRVQRAVTDGSERSPRQSVGIGKGGIGVGTKGFSSDDDAFWMSLASNLQEATECQGKDHEDDQKCQEDHEETGPERPVDVPAKVRVGRVHILVDVGCEEAKHLIGTVLVLLDRFDRELHPLVEGVIVIEGLFVFVDGTFWTGTIFDVVGIVAVSKSIDAGLLCVGGSYRRIGGSFRAVYVVILRA